MLTLLLATWGGLQRLGWSLPAAVAAAAPYHGPLMIGGFLGTVISLERAVALGHAWPYLAPILAAAGAVALLLGSIMIGQWLMLAASMVLTAVFIVIVRRQPAAFTLVMGLGAAAWAVGNMLWLSGAAIPVAVSWWIAFLVLTIVGERLELSRFLHRTARQISLFVAAASVFGLGLALGLAWSGLGAAVAGAGLIGLATWLIMWDLARRTVQQQGLTRYVAVCLLSGYGWLALGGALMVWSTVSAFMLHDGDGSWLHSMATAGPVYDAILHALLLGFVFAMIFGHAPIIFPAVLGVEMRYHPRFYAHLLLLELALALRVVGDLAGWSAGRTWGGLGNAVAIVLFLLSTVASIRFPTEPRKPSGPARGDIRLAQGPMVRRER